jgi:hypothetical protein
LRLAEESRAAANKARGAEQAGGQPNVLNVDVRQSLKTVAEHLERTRTAYALQAVKRDNCKEAVSRKLPVDCTVAEIQVAVSTPKRYCTSKRVAPVGAQTTSAPSVRGTATTAAGVKQAWLKLLAMKLAKKESSKKIRFIVEL